MASRAGIPGLPLALAAGGGVLLFLGIRGVPIQSGLRQILSGTMPAAGAGNGTGAIAAAEAAAGGTGTASGVGAGAHPEIATAAMAFKGDLYSQAKRWADGYSDCSSFVGKALKKCGITPPGASVTGSYLAWSKLTTISRSSIGAGDLLCGVSHIAIAIDSGHAIGQQNSRENVRIDTIDNIMWGTGAWVPRRYTGG